MNTMIEDPHAFHVNTTSLWHDVEDKLEHLGTTNAIMLGLFGVMLLLAGKRFMKFTLFLAGALTAGYATFVAFVYAADAANASDDVVAYGALATGCLGALVGGILAAKIVSLGLFLLGACAGASTGSYFQHIVFAEIFHDATSIPSYAPYLFIIGCALIGGIVVASLKDKLYAAVASIIGAFCVTQSWVFFAKYVNLIDILNMKENDTEIDSEEVWIEISSIIALSVLGTLYQWGVFEALEDCICCRSSSKRRSNGNGVREHLIEERNGQFITGVSDLA